MNINTQQSTNVNNLSAIHTQSQGMEDKIAEKKEMMQKKMEGQGVDISQIGRVSSFMSNLSPTDKVDVANFNKSIQDAKKNGSFDAATLAKEAPDAINQLAAQLEISTEEMLSNMTGNGIQGMISGNNPQTNVTGINTYMSVSTNQEQSNSILDLFNSLISDDEQDKKE